MRLRADSTRPLRSSAASLAPNLRAPRARGARARERPLDRRQGARRLERAHARGARARLGAAARAALPRRRRARGGRFLLKSLPRPRRGNACSTPGARGRRASRPISTTTRSWARASSSCTRRPASRAGYAEAHRLALLAVELFADPENGGFFLAPIGRRGARRAHEGPRRQPDPLGQLDARPRAAPARADLGRRRPGARGGLGAAARGADARPRSRRLRVGAVRARPVARAAARARDRRPRSTALFHVPRSPPSRRARSSRSAPRTACRCSRARASSTGSRRSTCASGSSAGRR